MVFCRALGNLGIHFLDWSSLQFGSTDSSTAWVQVLRALRCSTPRTAWKFQVYAFYWHVSASQDDLYQRPRYPGCKGHPNPLSALQVSVAFGDSGGEEFGGQAVRLGLQKCRGSKHRAL